MIARRYVYGNLTVGRDRPGLQQALALKELVDSIVSALQADPALPDSTPADLPPKIVVNPFA